MGSSTRERRRRRPPRRGLTTIVLDSGGVTALADRRHAAKIRAMLEIDAWPPVVPSVVVAECTTGQAQDANTNALLKRCVVVEDLPLVLAHRAGIIRFRAGRGSAVDAVVVAVASTYPDSVVVTSDPADLTALSQETPTVSIQRV